MAEERQNQETEQRAHRVTITRRGEKDQHEEKRDTPEVEDNDNTDSQ